MGEVLNVVNRFLKFGFDKTISMAPIVSLFVRWFRIYLLYVKEVIIFNSVNKNDGDLLHWFGIDEK